jgi:hypothetical protein
VSKPEFSRSVLLATTFVVSLGLLVWLLLFIFIRHGGPVAGYWVAQRGIAAPILAFQASDLGRILGRPPGNPPADVSSRDLGALVRERLARSGDGLSVIFLSAAGVSESRRPLLLATNHRPVDPPGDSGGAGLKADDRLDLLQEPPSKGGKCLLILDSGQIGTDRNLGVFGNGFVQRLATLMKEKKPKGLLILCSCAPGQVSWTSEADRRTVFGHFLARGLSGDAAGWDPSSHGLTARGLAAYARHQVARWVSEKRGAQQTPILLSADDTENFPLRPSVPPSAFRADKLDPGAAEELQKRLGEGWVRRDELETRRPFRHAPLLWRRYQETLLRAERLWRAGQDAEANGILGDLTGLERKLTERLGASAFGEPLSLALAEAVWAAVPPGDREKATRYRETIAAALSELAGEDDSRSVGSKAGPDRERLEGTHEPAEASPEAKPAQPAPEAAGKEEADGQGAAAGKEEAAARTTSRDRGPATRKTPKPAEAEPDGGAKVSVRPGVRPLATPRLTIDGDQGRPAYLEGQVLVWAAAFQKLGASRQFGSSDFFAGRRAQWLHDLVDLRTAAEIAAAGDERVHHWTAPLVELGDAIRRKAQDRLFAGGSSGGDGPTAERGDATPRRAREFYRQAAREAELFSKSLDLVQRLESELPYLGEWLARRNARLGLEGLGDDFETMLDDAAGLVELIIVDPRIADEGQTSRSAVDELLRAHAARVKAVKERFDRAGAGYDRIKGLLVKQCREPAEADGPEQWRELDDLLSVPMIPAEVRLPLIRKVRGASASSLDRSSSSDRPAGIKSDRAEGGGRGAGPGRPEDDAAATGDPSTAADPFFWGHALGMARLEWGLLRLGGVSERDLGRIEAADRAARKAVGGGTPAAAFDAFEELSAVVRAAHAAQMAKIEEARTMAWSSSRLSDIAIHRQLADADRAARVFPSAYAAAWSLDDTVADRLDRFHRYALVLWHGRRLLEDFAVDHGQLVLNRAQLASDGSGRVTTLALKEALDDTELRKSARLTVETRPADKLVIQDWVDHPLRFQVNSVGKVPPGEASALIGAGPTIPVAITAATSRHDAREGTLVGISPGTSPPPAEFLVARIEAADETRTFPITPGVFYRGRFFPADRDLMVTTDATSEPVSVTIHQNYRKIDRKIPDQFRVHPGKGFLHPGTQLAYTLKIERKTSQPMKVRVNYGLEGQTEPFRDVSLELTAAKPVGEITDLVDSQEAPADRPRNLIVTVTREGEGKPLSKRFFPFRQILPKDYIAVVPTLSPAEGKLHLVVKRLRTDPVTGPVPIFVRAAGETAQHVFQRGEVRYFSFSVPGQMTTIPWSVTVEEIADVIRGEVAANGPAGPGAQP